MADLQETFESALLRGAMALPERAQRALAGRPVVREGQTLATEIQLMLRLQKVARMTPAEELDWTPAREALARQSRLVGGRQPIGSVRDLTIPAEHGPLPARLYTPTSRLSDSAAPTMLFIHGGGMVYGGQHGTHDQAARFLAERSGVQLLSLDYRLAPEHPFPAAVEDCAAAYRWLVDNVARLDADPERLAVGGDSAGGYLSATTAITAAEEGRPCALQFLLYPCTDFVEASVSRRAFSEGFFLTQRFMDQATAAFFPDEESKTHPLGSVLRRTSFPEGLAPAYVATAGFDPLRDEGEAYATLLAEHGVTVEARRFPDMIHGFINMVGVGRTAVSHNVELAATLRRLLG
ncbi:MAG: alpha/beta hydrolase [Marmoricola sp.]